MIFIVWPFYLVHYCTDCFPFMPYSAGLINGLQRPLYVFGIFLVLLPLIMGRLTFIWNLLSHKIFIPLTWLNYADYNLHYPLLVALYPMSITFENVTNFKLYWYAVKICILTNLLAIPLVLFIEAPFANICELILWRKAKEKTEK